MSINSMANAAAARRPDIGVPGTTPQDLRQIAQAARTTPQAVNAGPLTPSRLIGAIGGLPRQPIAPSRAPSTAPSDATPGAGSVDSAYNTLFGYIPTEVVTLYVAVVTAISSKPENWKLDTLVAFLLITPLVVWIAYATKVKGAGKPIPARLSQWPVWEMVAAELAFGAWAFALWNQSAPDTTTVPTGLASLVVLATSTGLGLLSPLFQRPLPT